MGWGAADRGARSPHMYAGLWCAGRDRQLVCRAPTSIDDRRKDDHSSIDSCLLWRRGGSRGQRGTPSGGERSHTMGHRGPEPLDAHLPGALQGSSRRWRPSARRANAPACRESQRHRHWGPARLQQSPAHLLHSDLGQWTLCRFMRRSKARVGGLERPLGASPPWTADTRAA